MEPSQYKGLRRFFIGGYKMWDSYFIKINYALPLVGVEQ
jgi:hypothetical protein